jgi:hypothetical protein
MLVLILLVFVIYCVAVRSRSAEVAYADLFDQRCQVIGALRMVCAFDITVTAYASDMNHKDVSNECLKAFVRARNTLKGVIENIRLRLVNLTDQDYFCRVEIAALTQPLHKALPELRDAWLRAKTEIEVAREAQYLEERFGTPPKS